MACTLIKFTWFIMKTVLQRRLHVKMPYKKHAAQKQKCNTNCARSEVPQW